MLGKLPPDSTENSAASQEQFSSIAVGPRKLNTSGGTALRNIKAKEIFMTSKEKAELLFKQERLSGGPSSIPEYEQRARVERTKIAKLRVLRLAREAELAPKPEETGDATAKPASLSSAITHLEPSSKKR
jgi:hypothetical protein